jgi:predicted glycogen debranching enzyme
VVDDHLRGTRYGIYVDGSDGLLMQGADGLALTWMDARIDGRPVTQRRGKAVEINALWINGLAAVADLAERTGADGSRYRRLRDLAVASFRRRFARAAGCLDVVDGPAGDDASLRPNQLLAVSLPAAPLADRRVVESCGPLLTSLGLRTLAAGAPGYRGVHRGTPAERDGAYHQGTVWPWLIGPFLTAYVKAHGDTPEARDRVDRWLQPLREHLWQGGLGQISEVFDGAAPQRPAGCSAQAWSVAEVLRAYVEDAQGRRPAEPGLTKAGSAAR